MEWFRLRGTSRGHLVQSTAWSRANSSSFLRAVSHWVLNTGTVQNLTPCTVKLFFLLSNQKRICLCLCVLPAGSCAESTKVSLKPSLLQDELTQLFQPLPICCVLHPAPWSAWWSLLDSLQNISIFLALESPNLNAALQICSQLTFLDLLATLLPLCNWKPSHSFL